MMAYKPLRKSAIRNTKQIHYLIVTTGKETEINYFKAFYESLDENIKKYITIDYEVCSINKLIKKASEKASQYPNTYRVWLVFDTDKDTKIIKDVANNANAYGYNIAFSNPCIELWFLAYFGKSPTYKNNPNITASKKCINDLKKYISEYEKNDKKIYEILTTEGSEIKAINIARKKHSSYKNVHILEMYGATNMYELIEEIRKPSL